MQLHNIADLFVWGAYVAIPFVLLYYARHRKDLPFKHLFWLFGLFIAACGTTHLMTYVTTFSPMYRLEGLIKVITALASWGTVVAIAAISPRALAMRMPEELEREIQAKEEAKRNLEVINASLAERTKQLEDANAELEGFTYLVAHDLRSPLRGIVAHSRIVIEDNEQALDESSRENLERLGASALRMSALIDGLLEFSRLGRQALRMTDVDVSLIAEGIAEELRGEYPATVEVQAGVRVRADAALLRIVLYNLIQNACKYASQERHPHVRVGQVDTPNGPALFVSDNGIGFDMAYVAKIFQPFERLTHDSKIPGTGIGLANVRRIIERHGGTIWAESQPGAGATFYVRLPSGDA